MDKLAERANRELISAARSGDRLRFVEAYVAVILYVPLAKQRNEATKPDLFDCNYLPTNKYHHHLQQAIKPVSYNHPPSDCRAEDIKRDRLQYRADKLILENSFLAGFTIHDLEPHLQSIKKRGNSASLIMHAWLMVQAYQWRNPQKPLRDIYKMLAQGNIQLTDQKKTSVHWTMHNWQKVFNDAARLIASDKNISRHVHWIELQTQAEKQAALTRKQIKSATQYETSNSRRLYTRPPKMSEDRKLELGIKRAQHQENKDFERKFAKLLDKAKNGNFEDIIKAQQAIIRVFSI